MADWSGLDPNLLSEIAKRIPSVESLESFAGVCKSWEGVTKEYDISWAQKQNFNQTIFEGIWLMFGESDDENSREFCSVSLGINTTRKIFLPDANKQHCVSCKDWLVINSPDEIEASLLHPLSGVEIHLPKLNTMSEYSTLEFSHFIKKAVISANPATNSDYIVIILCISTCSLAFWKCGDTTWTSIDWLNAFDDVIYSNNDNKLYGMDEMGVIISCDIDGSDPFQLRKLSDEIPHDDDLKWATRAYLVELSGGKFLVVRKYVYIADDRKLYHTKKFKIFEVNIVDGKWVEVYDLGNKALFLGYNTSLSMECSEFNKYIPNCIYYTDDVYDFYLADCHDDGFGGGKDMGIYRVSDGSIKPLYDDKIGRSVFTPPLWMGPSF